MKILSSFCFILAAFAVAKSADSNAEINLLRSLLKEVMRESNEVEMIGIPLQFDQRDLDARVRRLSYLTEKRAILDEMEHDIEEDETLNEAERDTLLESFDTIIRRSYCPYATCPSYKYECPTERPLKCLKRTYLVDGTPQCQDGSDEDEQVRFDFFEDTCGRKGKYHCLKNDGTYKCISRDRMCDGSAMCADGSDQDPAVCAAQPACDDPVYNEDNAPVYESCGDNQCVKIEELCDGTQECVNGADEVCNDDDDDDDVNDDNDVDDVDEDDDDDNDDDNSNNNDDSGDSDSANAERDEFLHAHNVLRDIHVNTESVTWNQVVADRAQLWADHLAENALFQHSVSGSEYRDSSSGENIYKSSSMSVAVTRAITAFYKEEYESEYHYESGTGNGGMIGHFTQIVWDNSLTIGCGVARNGGTYVVCQYSPSGNYVGTYPAHVNVPKDGVNPRQVNEDLRDST